MARAVGTGEEAQPLGVEALGHDGDLGLVRSSGRPLEPQQGALGEVVGQPVDVAELVDQLGGAHVVERDPVDHHIALGVLVGLHPTGDAGVRSSPVGLGEGAVGDLADEVGAERPLLPLVAPAEDEEILGLERLEHRPHVVDPEVLPGHHLDGHHRAAAPEHGTVVEDAPLVGREPVEAGGHQPAEGVGELDEAGVGSLGRPVGADHARVGQQRDELLEEEGVAAAAGEQRVRELGAELGAGQLLEQQLRALGGERVERDHHQVVATVGRVPAILDDLARGGEDHEAAAGQAVEEGVDEVEHQIVGPVEVGEHHHDRPVERVPLRVGDHGGGRLVARAGRIDPAQLGVVAHQVEQALVDPLDLGRVGPLAQRDAHGRAGHLHGLVGGVARADPRAVAEGVRDGPPDVGLAVRDAASLEDEGVVLALGVARQLLGEPGLPDAGLPQQQEQRPTGVADRVLDAVAQEAQLGLAPDEPRPVALRSVARRRDRRLGPPRRHELLASLDVDRLERLVADRAARRRERGRADDHLAGLGGALQPVGRVHDVAHRRVVAAGPERAHQHLARVDPDPHADVDAQLGRGQRERLLHPQGGAHGALSVVLVRGGRTEQRHDGVADDLVDAAAEGVDLGHEPPEAVVDQVLHLLRIPRLGQRGVPDQVREEDRDDPTLIPPQPQVLTALGAEPCACRHVRMAAGAGHHARMYRGGSALPPIGDPEAGARDRGQPSFRFCCDPGTVPRMTMTSPTPAAPTTAAARAEQAVKIYGLGDTEVRALDGVTVDFETGRFTAIMGPSGSGKSTLMHCVAGLDTLTSGRALIGDTDLTTLNDKALTQVRRDKVGFVFQSFNLIPTLDAIENITLPMDLAGRKPDTAWVDQVVATVGLGDRLKHRPSELSGGQQQRVAVARALAAQPAIIFADEPTGNLDSKAGAEILTFMRKAVDDLGQTIVMVSHDPVAAAYADRVVFLVDGRIVHEMQDPTAEQVIDQMKSLGDA